ncbi:hypothetical protein OESDEN_14066 [Oesophagostomum dentatum]|uniref:Uncharacterized protein n=1 Tax=Oesophagostomum dentatum TaxID=61180 RepID=A0A0B1SRR7_OESDE|nr:hypothetical protein OESDEN_14066 [Oesophagostomum dentatum]
MLHLSHLCFVLFTLCRTSAEVEKTDLVPGTVKIWNLSGSEANFADNITKFVGFPNGKSLCTLLAACPCPSQATGNVQRHPPRTLSTTTPIDVNLPLRLL